MKQFTNRLDQVLSKDKNLLSIFFTAGFPNLDATLEILKMLEEEGVDFVEIGFPFSDPIADGSVIQNSNQVALSNGMNLELLFSQLKEVRKTISMPLILMGYLNPVEQYGFERFLKSAQEVGIDGLILPDLPLELLESKYKSQINEHDLHFISLVSPTSSDERIRKIDQISTSFVYAVSSTAVTGGKGSNDDSKVSYFQRLKNLGLKSPITVGFGLDSKASLELVYKYFKAGIVGSAFLRSLEGQREIENGREFIRALK
jgi:tryptophan synthase alpha chain